MRTIEDYIVDERHGLDIALSVSEPDGEPIAAAILCPGFLDSREYPHLVGLSEAMAEAGIVTARFDPVGTWDSGGVTEDDYRLSRYLGNITTVRGHMAAAYGTQEVIVGGHSLGGLASILHAGETATRAVVALCTPKEMKGTASPTWQQDGSRTVTRSVPGSTEERAYAVPWAFAEDSAQYSALTAVATYQKTPLLLVAGLQDTVVPTTEVLEIFGAAHRPVNYVSLPIEHNYRIHPEQVTRVTDVVMWWLSVILKPGQSQTS